VLGFLILIMSGVAVKYLQIYYPRPFIEWRKFIGGFILAILGLLAYFIITVAIKFQVGHVNVFWTLYQSIFFISLLGFGLFYFKNKANMNAGWLVIVISFFLLSTASINRLYLESCTQFGAMPETPAITALKDITDPSRGGEWGRIIRYHDGPINVMSMSDQPYTFYPNLGTYFGIPDAFGYHNLVPKERFEELRSIETGAVIERRGIVAFTERESLDDPRLKDMGIRYVLSDSQIDGLELLWSTENFYIHDLGHKVVKPVDVVYEMPGLKQGIIVIAASWIIWLLAAAFITFRKKSAHEKG